MTELENLITVTLTKEECDKLLGVLSVFQKPLEKSVKTQVIPKYKREAEKALNDINSLANKFKYEVGESNV